ncbi:MAG: hypothetical protein Q8M66_06940 [Actinomycetota bacterium]|nr:hypothetical protein [Actinomycetota bacterium]MDZ4180904.1 hypothetical protein [Coriobacteriia bacterium]
MLGGPTGFEAQFQEFMFYAGSIAQLLYYAVLPIVAIWAVLVFKRLVDHKTSSGVDESADVYTGIDASLDATTEQPIKVEKFVE